MCQAIVDSTMAGTAAAAVCAECLLARCNPHHLGATHVIIPDPHFWAIPMDAAVSPVGSNPTNHSAVMLPFSRSRLLMYMFISSKRIL